MRDDDPDRSGKSQHSLPFPSSRSCNGAGPCWDHHRLRRGAASGCRGQPRCTGQVTVVKGAPLMHDGCSRQARKEPQGQPLRACPPPVQAVTPQHPAAAASRAPSVPQVTEFARQAGPGPTCQQCKEGSRSAWEAAPCRASPADSTIAVETMGSVRRVGQQPLCKCALSRRRCCLQGGGGECREWRLCCRAGASGED